MQQLPRLYSRTATGATQIWDIVVEGNTYYTISGQIEGAKITSEPTVVQGKNTGKKNATTAEQQAYKDAESHWKKKLKLKYFENIEDIDKTKTIQGGVEFVKPMRAKNYADYREKLAFPMFIQRKYNGARVMATKSGLLTRGGELYKTLPHIEEVLAPIFDKHPDLVIDGEAYSHDYRYELNKLMSIVRSNVHFTAEDLAESKSKIKLFVYDGYGMDGTDESASYQLRLSRLKAILTSVPFIELVPTYLVENHEDINVRYQAFLQEGYEGAMIRYLDAPYEHKKSKFILKYKPIMDAEFEIVGVVEGEGNRAGMAGTVQCKMEDGRIFGASLKGSEEQFAEVWKNRANYIGKTVTIYFNDYTGKGIPNYAQFDLNNYNKNDR